MRRWIKGLTTLLCLGLPVTALFIVKPLRADQPSFQSWVKGLEGRKVKVTAGIWDLDSGKLLESENPDLALVPASTTKVVSTYAMLRVWKPNFTLQTEVLGDLKDGVVRGDLVFKGGGDPYLTNERLYGLAEDLRRAGVNRVTGGVRLDQSLFDGQRYGNGWDNTSSDTTPPILPLAVNFNRDDRGIIVSDPEKLAISVIRRIFTEAGIAFENRDSGGQGRSLTVLASPPLRMLIQDINKFSNNFMVETLVKRFGDGTWPRGIQRIQEFYSSNYGLGPDKIQLTDGSGLSKENRLSARTLAIVLRGGYNDFEVGSEFISSLKVIGGEPFRLHIKDPNLARRIRCKTGHLAGVSSVCGFLQTPQGKLRVFAIILNGDAHELDLWEQVSRWAN